MKLLALAFSLLLTACCPKPLIVKEPVEVKVMVPVPCQVEHPAKPVWQLDYPDVRQAGLFVKGNSALVELEQRRRYEAELEAALTSCTVPTGRNTETQPPATSN